MHYNLLFNGCSYTQGSELEGLNHDFEYRNRHRYSHIISERLGKTYDNISIGNNSNDRIVRETLEWFNAGNTCDLAIIQWSHITRAEYISPYAKHPVNFNPKFVTTKWEGTKKINQDHEETKLAHEHYYKYYYSPMVGIYNFYKNLYILEQFFEKKNINYFMIKLSPNFYVGNKSNKIYLNDHHPNDLSDFYWKTLCKHNFFDIPNIIETILSKDKENFTPNYTHLGHKYLYGSHPSELGHQKIADFVISKIESK